ncbi:MAG TPA: CYTH and CHAD domain-containing protein [Candidatus Dormibacteraeota bacterium]|nr:CYTH and CHAD domain-containing protein [Candidatus Dormibacteraeota bacterium]
MLKPHESLAFGLDSRGTNKEREVKLGAGPAFHLPDLAGVIEGVAVAPPETVRMETVYYDTPDFRLARWGVSLRRRAGEGWTLKLAPPPSTPGKPAAVLERDELTFQGGATKPPEAALEVVRAYVRKSELIPVARLSTVRRRVRLVDATGTRVAEVVDDEVSVRDGRRVAARFREIEVEIPSTNGGTDAGLGWDTILTPLVTRLRVAGAGAPDPTPKHIRALGPRAIEPPEVSPQPLPPGAPARDVIRNVLAESVAALLRHDPLVRSGRDPEAVHQARVATRKLRSNLRTFGPLLDPEWTEPLRSELGWLAMGLGAVRDREVLLARLRERAKSLPAGDQKAATALLHLLELEIDELRKKLLADLRSQRYIDLLERLVDAAHSPQTLPDAEQPATTLLPALATSPWRRLRSAVRQLPETPTDPELHRIRILAKRARYAAEAVAPVVGDAAAAFGRAAAKLQTILGEHQDSVTAQAWLRSAKVTGKRAFVAGELIALDGLAAAEARGQWPKVWEALDRKRLREWMP